MARNYNEHNTAALIISAYSFPFLSIYYLKDSTIYINSLLRNAFKYLEANISHQMMLQRKNHDTNSTLGYGAKCCNQKLAARPQPSQSQSQCHLSVAAREIKESLPHLLVKGQNFWCCLCCFADFSHFVGCSIQYVERPFWLFCFCSSCWLDSTLISVSVARSVRAHSYASAPAHAYDCVRVEDSADSFCHSSLYASQCWHIPRDKNSDWLAGARHHLHIYYYYMISTQADSWGRIKDLLKVCNLKFVYMPGIGKCARLKLIKFSPMAAWLFIWLWHRFAAPCSMARQLDKWMWMSNSSDILPAMAAALCA